MDDWMANVGEWVSVPVPLCEKVMILTFSLAVAQSVFTSHASQKLGCSISVHGSFLH